MDSNSFGTPAVMGGVRTEKCWTASTSAQSRGYGVCYNSDYGTATTAEQRRNRDVEAPSSSNNLYFAGVLTQAYAASSIGQTVEIALPGSVCEIYVDGSVTLGDMVTCIAGSLTTGYTAAETAEAGIFSKTYKGFVGRGSARCLQTRTGAGLVLARLMDGPESGLVEKIVPKDNSARQSMVGGVTHLIGGITLGAGDSTSTLADADFGTWKGFKLHGALTTQDYLLTVTNGEQLDGTTDLASLEFDADLDSSVLQFGITKWRLMHNSGPTIA